MNNLAEIKNRIIETAYPELHGKGVQSEWAKLDDCYGAFSPEIGSETQLIEIDEELKNIPEKILVGVVGHELAHVIDFIDKDYFQQIFAVNFIIELQSAMMDGRKFSPPVEYLIHQYIKQEERKMDLITIERGLGDELLTFTEFRDEQRKKIAKSISHTYDGLTSQEIKRLLKAKNKKNKPYSHVYQLGK